jgi:hypothetical protein
MIEVSCEGLDLEDSAEVRKVVERELGHMDAYLSGSLNIHPMMKIERSILREYLHAKLRDKISEERIYPTSREESGT